MIFLLTQLTGDTRKPYNVISLDTEADENGETYVYCVCGYYGKKRIQRVFYNREACVKFLFKRRWHNTVLTGLNLAFDLNTLYGRRNGFNWDSIMNMGRLITATPTKEERKKLNFRYASEYLKIIDLGNFILNMSLKTMAEKFCIEGHIDKHILGRDGDKKELTEACISHCWTGVEIFCEIQRKIQGLGGNVKLTGPATSLELYRRRYLKTEHQIFDHKPKGETEEEKTKRENKIEYMKRIGRAAYAGGATQAFKLGLYNNVTYLDINSSYPFQMSERDFPDIDSYKRYTKDLSVSFLENLMENEEGEALIQIKTPDMLIPILYTKNEANKLIFPLGTLTGWYTYPEIKYSISLGYEIKEVYEIASFRRMESPFKEYVSDMMEYKKTCKPVAKLLANGLSGKFGQRVPENDSWEICEFDKDIVVDNETYFSINGQLWKYNKDPVEKRDIDYMPYAYPLIVAYVTAWGRIQEHQAIMAIGPENVYYMDTDSIIADDKATKAAIDRGDIKIDPSELGAFDIEHKGATVDIRGEKYYRIREAGQPWTYHIKGVPSRVMAQHWKYRKCAYYRPRKIKTALRSGKKVNEFIRVFHGDRTLPNKRIFSENGRSSKPLTVET